MLDSLPHSLRKAELLCLSDAQMAPEPSIPLGMGGEPQGPEINEDEIKLVLYRDGTRACRPRGRWESMPDSSTVQVVVWFLCDRPGWHNIGRWWERGSIRVGNSRGSNFSTDGITPTFRNTSPIRRVEQHRRCDAEAPKSRLEP